MRINRNVNVFGSKIILVPYRKDHVLRYHDWMKSTKLQELTASEPLTLQQEYDMQISWLNDDDKCTFIILARDIYIEGQQNESDAMIGDVNLFFNDVDDRSCAEIELMVAETDYRHRGIGKETLILMMSYGVNQLNVKTYKAKIGYKNEISLNLFKKFGFEEESRSEIFKEITYSLNITEDVKTWLENETVSSKIIHVDYGD